MNICLFAIVNYWQGVNGGMEIHGKILCEGLVKRGHDVTVISTRHPGGTEFEEINGVNIHYLRNTTFGTRRNGWRVASTNKFIQLDQKRKFDVICCQSAVVPIKLKKLDRYRNIPIVVIIEAHEGMNLLSEIRQTVSHKEGFIRIVKKFLAFLYYYALWELPLLHKYDAVIGVSDEVSRSIRKWHFVNSQKVYTVYNGIDTVAFRPDKKQRKNMRSKYALDSNEKVLLFLSHITKQKGLDQLIKAMPGILKIDEKVKVFVVGDGVYLKEAKKLVQKLELNDNVIFTGHIAHENTPKYINASDIYILPTLRGEGLPFALLEAMACQKPVIASRMGGIPSAIRDGVNGLLVSPGDDDDLIKKTIYLMDNETHTQKLASNARMSVLKKFGVDSMVDQTAQVLEKAIL
jgi:glycosyltransferase involved in cell wall biosynthesis